MNKIMCFDGAKSQLDMICSWNDSYKSVTFKVSLDIVTKQNRKYWVASFNNETQKKNNVKSYVIYECLSQNEKKTHSVER